MDGRLRGKVAFVTGGDTGIGAAVARRLAGEGAAVAVAYREEPAAAEKLAAELRRAVAVPCDVAGAGSVAAAVAASVSALGLVSVLVNNAAVLHRTPFAEIGEAEWDEVVRVALYGAFHCARAVVPGMVAAGSGSIVSSARSSSRSAASCSRTAFVERVPLRRLGLPDDVAGAVAYLASDDAAWVTGQVLGVNGGLALV